MQSWTSLLGFLLAAFVFTGTPFIISIMSSVFVQHCQLLYPVPQENIKHYSHSKFRYPSWLKTPWIFLGFCHLAWHLALVSLLQNKQWLCGRGESLSKHLGLGQQVVQSKQDNNAQLWFSVNRCHSYIYLPFLPYFFCVNTIVIRTVPTHSPSWEDSKIQNVLLPIQNHVKKNAYILGIPFCYKSTG